MLKQPSVPEGVKVRAAAVADIPELGRLGTLLISLHHEFDPKRFIGTTASTRSTYASYLESQLGRSDVILLVADCADAILGYTYASLEGYDYMALRGPAGVIHDLFVEPNRRREGIGRMLLEATVAELEVRGSERVILSTASRNGEAQRLFASQGFRSTMIEMTRELVVSAKDS